MKLIKHLEHEAGLFARLDVNVDGKTEKEF